MNFTVEEQEDRKAAFNEWWRTSVDKLEWNVIPAIWQAHVHQIAKQSFYAGHRFERRRHLTVETGGDW